MRVLIVDATSEGHTRDLVRFIADGLTAAGNTARAVRAPPAAEAPFQFDAVILAGSLHLQRYQAALARYARAWNGALNAVPSAFISVSLAAAGAYADRDGLSSCVKRFERLTGWRPHSILHVAGAISFSAHGLLTRLAIKFIANQRGIAVTTERDYDFTDYGALGAFAHSFINQIAASKRLFATA